jgi:hypothetical protein
LRLLERARIAIGRHPRRVWRAYQDVFSGEAAKIVLVDMADNAGLLDSEQSTDPIKLALAAGRRQNFLVVLDRLNMSFGDIVAMQQHIERELGGDE